MDEEEKPSPMIFVQEPKHLAFSRDIIHCHPYLRERWPGLMALYQEDTGHDLFLTCTWRSVKEQQKLYNQGRMGNPGPIVTMVDGINRRSNHNPYPARAFDVAVDIDADFKKVKVSWDISLYLPLGRICHQLGLEWGGNFSTIKDYPHIEVPKEVV